MLFRSICPSVNHYIYFPETGRPEHSALLTKDESDFFTHALMIFIFHTNPTESTVKMAEVLGHVVHGYSLSHPLCLMDIMHEDAAAARFFPLVHAIIQDFCKEIP